MLRHVIDAHTIGGVGERQKKKKFSGFVLEIEVLGETLNGMKCKLDICSCLLLLLLLLLFLSYTTLNHRGPMSPYAMMAAKKKKKKMHISLRSKKGEGVGVQGESHFYFLYASMQSMR